jgi:hypothetical protein
VIFLRIRTRRVETLILGTLLLGGCIQPIEEGKVSIASPETTSPKRKQDLNKLNHTPTTKYSLQEHEASFPFESLSSQEKQSPWGVEYYLGDQLAREHDWYRAITALKRADLLCPVDSSRKSQIEYLMILCYYQAKKYLEVVHHFEKSSLSSIKAHSFPAFEDMIMILSDSYHQIGQEEKEGKLKEFLHANAPVKGRRLETYHRLTGRVPSGKDLIGKPEDALLHESTQEYLRKRKDPKRARFLNAILPGAGYWYIGQKETAVTAFLVNALFIATSYHFLHHGYTAAGILAGGLELGWYVGGINGVGIAAQEQNRRTYEKIAKRKLTDEKIFPIFSLSFSY